jgi:hypothetical protein
MNWLTSVRVGGIGRNNGLTVRVGYIGELGCWQGARSSLDRFRSAEHYLPQMGTQDPFSKLP